MSPRIAIVTGGSRGIGAAISLTFVKHGFDVAIVYTSQASTQQADDLSKQVGGLGRKAILVRTDLADRNCGMVVRDAVLKGLETDKVDVLVNNAGIVEGQDTLSIEMEQYTRVMDISLRAPILLVKTLAPHMNPGGCIISMSSIFAREPYAGFDACAALKSGLEGLTRQWAATLGKSHGIASNAIICGTIETDMIEGYGDEVLELIRERAVAEHRLGMSDDFAQVVAFLASEGSRWVTGQCIGVHGGRIFN